MQKVLHFGKTGPCRDNLPHVCAAASLHVYDPFFDKNWAFQPTKKRQRRARRVQSVSVEKLIAHLLK
jgi:hypothetical protein